MVLPSPLVLLTRDPDLTGFGIQSAGRCGVGWRGRHLRLDRQAPGWLGRHARHRQPPRCLDRGLSAPERVSFSVCLSVCLSIFVSVSVSVSPPPLSLSMHMCICRLTTGADQGGAPCCPSPLSRHSLCVQHQITWARITASYRPSTDFLLTNRSAKLGAITEKVAFYTRVATSLAVLSIDTVSA
jgi:hypothetical protein